MAVRRFIVRHREPRPASVSFGDLFGNDSGQRRNSILKDMALQFERPVANRNVVIADRIKAGKQQDWHVGFGLLRQTQVTPPCRQAARKKATPRVTCGPISIRSCFSFSPNNARITRGSKTKS